MEGSPGGGSRNARSGDTKQVGKAEEEGPEKSEPEENQEMTLTFERALVKLKSNGYQVGKPWIHEKDGKYRCLINNLTRAEDWIIREATEGPMLNSVPLSGPASDQHKHEEEFGPSPWGRDS